MKIAIVTGWEGVVQQKRRWSLDAEIIALERTIANTERSLQARRSHLARLIADRDAIPNRESTLSTPSTPQETT